MDTIRFEKTLTDPTPLTPNTLMFKKLQNNELEISMTDETGSSVMKVFGSADLASIPVNSSSEIFISGPSEVIVTALTQFEITNFDTFTDYVLTDVIGNAYIEGVYVNYVAPAVVGVGGFTINGKVISLTVRERKVLPPTILTPVSGSVNLNRSFTATTSDFTTEVGTDIHESTQWELYSDPTFTTLVISYDNLIAGEKSKFFTGLEINSTYYLRVRYKGSALGYSDWSTSTVVTTRPDFLPNTEVAALVPAAVTIDNFGFCDSLCITADGSRLVMSLDAVQANGYGEVYVYRREVNSWVLEQTINQGISIAVNNLDNFGRMTAINESGTKLLVYAPSLGYDVGIQTGGIYIYDRVGTVWSLFQLITTDTATTDLHQEFTITDTRVIWSGLNNMNVLKLTNGVYVNETVEVPGTLRQYEILGMVSAINGDETVIATGTGNGIIIYERTGSNWNIVFNEGGIAGEANNYFGQNVDIDQLGETVVLSCEYDPLPDLTNKTGSVIIYKKINGTWSRTDKIVSSFPANNNSGFGIAIAISGDGSLIAVSDFYAHWSPYTDSGVIQMFKQVNGVWTNVDSFNTVSVTNTTLLGYDLAMSTDSQYLIAGSDKTANSPLYVFH